MKWTARDWRQFVALTLLAAGDIPLTMLLGYSLWILWQQPRNGGALTIALGIIGLIAVNRIGISAVLGRRKFNLTLPGGTRIEGSGEGMEQVVGKMESGE